MEETSEREPADPLRAYLAYVEAVEASVATDLALGTSPKSPTTAALMNGGPSQALRELVDPADRKDLGVFFTPIAQVNQALAGCAECATARSILDPTCGAGDPLIAIAERLPVRPSLKDTVSDWGERLHGWDLSGALVRLSKARLLVAAMRRVDRIDGWPADPFPHVEVRDAMAGVASTSNQSVVFMNPPYSTVTAATTWASGAVSAAAVIFDRVVDSLKPGQHVVAVLPDVLRSGSRYGRWRKEVARRGLIDSLQLHGAFASDADVDVFAMHFTVGAPGGLRSWWPAQPSSSGTFGDRFTVRVGPVVPHRHAEAGHRRRYLVSAHLRGKTEVQTSSLPWRRFAGTVFDPPFIALQRTSSPRDTPRVRAAIVTGREPVAVENHVLVMHPTDGGLDECRAAMPRLGEERMRDWLDARIRCRHLTVDAVKGGPW
jgi:hypothetical protein